MWKIERSVGRKRWNREVSTHTLVIAVSHLRDLTGLPVGFERDETLLGEALSPEGMWDSGGECYWRIRWIA